ncbi:hypothetical protein [Sulfurimonas sp.]
MCSKCKEHCNGVTDWLEAIADERERQIKKGWTPDHDDKVNKDGYLTEMACYFVETPEENTKHLVKAAAVIVAELERRERAENGNS